MRSYLSAEFCASANSGGCVAGSRSGVELLNQSASRGINHALCRFGDSHLSCGMTALLLAATRRAKYSQLLAQKCSVASMPNWQFFHDYPCLPPTRRRSPFCRRHSDEAYRSTSPISKLLRSTDSGAVSFSDLILIV